MYNKKKLAVYDKKSWPFDHISLCLEACIRILGSSEAYTFEEKKQTYRI